MNRFDVNNMRIEIAVLQEDVDASNPGTAKFRIPVLMTNQDTGVISVNNSNILNRNAGTLGNVTINIDNTIDLYIPTQHTIYAGVDVIPAGTRFIVCFVGGNPNDIRIIGLYDYDHLTPEEETYNGIIGHNV